MLFCVGALLVLMGVLFMILVFMVVLLLMVVVFVVQGKLFCVGALPRRSACWLRADRVLTACGPCADCWLAAGWLRADCVLTVC